MKIEKDKLEAMVMRGGRVLVEVNEFEKTKIGSIHVTAYADESKVSLTARSGTVVKLPETTDIPHHNYAFKSEQEIEIGDRVWWSANAAGTIILLKENVRFECDGKEYIIMPYPEIILAKRGDMFFGVNDRVVGKKTEAIKSSIIDLSASSLSEPDPDKFIVVYTPSFRGNYMDNRLIVSCDVGEVVKLAANGGVAASLESDIQGELEGLFYFRSADIIAK